LCSEEEEDMNSQSNTVLSIENISDFKSDKINTKHQQIVTKKICNKEPEYKTLMFETFSNHSFADMEQKFQSWTYHEDQSNIYSSLSLSSKKDIYLQGLPF
jgi:hypothetical protein